MEQQLYASAAEEASAVVSAVPARVSKIIFHNDNVAARYLQIFDSATVPADTAVPTICIAVPADTTYVLDFPRDLERRAVGGLDRFPKFTAGVAVCNSTTAATKTVGSADSLFYVFGEAE